MWNFYLFFSFNFFSDFFLKKFRLSPILSEFFKKKEDFRGYFGFFRTFFTKKYTNYPRVIASNLGGGTPPPRVIGAYVYESNYPAPPCAIRELIELVHIMAPAAVVHFNKLLQYIPELHLQSLTYIMK